jgi:HlyD family secretion protein
MKWIKAIVIIGVLAGAAFWGWKWHANKKKTAEVVHYRTAKVVRTDIFQTVEATGTVEPIKEVEVGAQVNGRIIKLLVDYNSSVTNGQVVALIDPQVYDANYKSALGELHGNQANVKRYEAQLALAEKTLVRKEKLMKSGMAPIAEYDAALEARDIAKASLESAHASVERSLASVSQAKANLEYCTIVSPVNGVVIERSVDEGQTVVSSMNAVPLLKIAEDLKVIQVEATVPEADVGVIRVGQEVTFTADAYRRKFKGRVKQIRLAATTTNNVVTYPIIIEAENPGEMLFPGMTANISVEVARSENTLAVTSAAFRFRPKDVPFERTKDKFVWVKNDNGILESIKVEPGISDSSFTEIKSPLDLENKEVILGYVSNKDKSLKPGQTKNPFMPTPPKRNKNRGTAPAPKEK